MHFGFRGQKNGTHAWKYLDAYGRYPVLCAYHIQVIAVERSYFSLKLQIPMKTLQQSSKPESLHPVSCASLVVEPNRTLFFLQDTITLTPKVYIFKGARSLPGTRVPHFQCYPDPF